MRRGPGAALAAMLALLVGAAAPATAGDEPLIVFAAASLQGPLDAVAARWSRESGRDVVISYASSAALARQIDRGAPAGVFVSADGAWMDWLAARGRIDAASRADLLGNALVLVAPRRASTVPARSVRDALPNGLGRTGRLAVADVETVPAGRYAKQALQAIGRWDAVAARLAPADDVRVALAFVARGEAPLGIVYATDALAEADVRVVARFADGTHASIVYPVAAVAGADAGAVRFVRYLRTDAEVADVFRAAGFMPLPDPGDRRGAVPPRSGGD